MIPGIALQRPLRGALRQFAAAYNDITNRVFMPSLSNIQRRLRLSFFSVLSGFVLTTAAHAGTVSNTTNYDYDPVTGQLTAQVQEPGNAQLNLRTQYTYGQFGNLLTTQVSSTATALAAIPTHTSSTLEYDANGVVPMSATNALGHLVKTAFTPFSLPLSHTDANGLTTTWQYDGLGRKTQEKRPDGTITRWQYILCGAGATCTGKATYVVLASQFAADGSTANGPWVKTYLDRLDRAVRIETDGFSGVSIVDTEYDGEGRVARVSRPYFANAPIQWTVNSYDVLGRLVSITSPDNSVVSKSYNGLTTTTTNALKQTQTWLVDSQGKVLKVTDTQNNSLSYSYNALGNLTKTTDPKGNTVELTYDVLGRKTSMTDPDLGTLSYSYDVLGRLRQQTDARSNVTTMTYDLLGRVTNRAEVDLVSTWNYDSCSMGKGRMCRATADNGYSIDYSFDALGRQTQSTTKIDTDYLSKVTYDANGHVATTVYPTGLTLKHIYTPAGYPKEIRNNATNALYWQANATDAEGRLVQQTYGNGVVEQQVFDVATGRTKNIYAGAGNAVQNLSFSYDLRGNMLTRNDANQNLAETFLYDPLNRLTSNTVNSLGAGLVTQTYGYDSIGNMTSRSDMGAYTYGGVNMRPHAVAEIALTGGGKRQYSYDATGNLVKEEQRDSVGNLVAAKGRTGSYTSFDMPVTLANPAASLTFVYGPDHQRVKQITPSGTTIYVNPDNVGALLYEKEIKADGSVEHKHYITSPSGVAAMITQTVAATTTLYLHRDHLGSTTAITDESGALKERMAYEPFGKRRTPAGAIDLGKAIVGVATDRGFTNHEHLDELGLIHMNGRVYDPAISRFMTADPSVPYPTNIQSYNRYSYVRNNPLVMIDPSGFCDRDWRSVYISACNNTDTRPEGSEGQGGAGSSQLPGIQGYARADFTTSVGEANNGDQVQIVNDHWKTIRQVYGTPGQVMGQWMAFDPVESVGRSMGASDSTILALGIIGMLRNPTKLVREGLPTVVKTVNSKLPHAAFRATQRAGFETEAAAADALRALSKTIETKGWPPGSILDTRLNRVLVPFGDGGLAVYLVEKNGTAKLRTILEVLEKGAKYEY
ncbi:hypothetical protein LXA47_08390 [Massilia sp. P8910]|uniref:RHS repeat domain-containing protein n=1 Tax=Massilia antarctica TaxID=2765360 RepID=UPI001E2F5B19|nr:RHS repeat domain-containing protein [Massilia antarctica]MCE3603624.1 hypothetical protein [Massilia antarctica]